MGTSLATATALFYEKLFCQLSNLTRTPEGAMTVLNSVQTQLSGTGVVFPSDPTAIVDALTQGECKQAADLLAAANGQTLMANPVFNELINGKFDDIEKGIIDIYTPKPTILFVNGHYSKLLPGPSEGGSGYWTYFDTNHLTDAQTYFNIRDAAKDYADGSSLLGIDTDYNDRREMGKSYAEASYENWKKVAKNNVFYIVAHSEGCGMAAGIADYLLSKNEKIGEMIFLSCDEGAEPLASVDERAPTYQLEYIYWSSNSITGSCSANFDWVIGTNLRYQTYNGIRGVRKFGIAINNRLDYGTVHGSSGNILSISPLLTDLKQTFTIQNMNGQGKIYDSQSIDRTKFYKINDRIILPNNPQWNTVTHIVDTSLPCIIK